MKLINDMPEFLSSNISDFKNHRKSIEEMWRNICAYVEEIITIFAHLAGSRDGENDWDSITRMISNSEPYEKYLSGHLKKIYTEWINYFLNDYNEKESLRLIQNEIQEIFHNCGLNFQNVKDGIYITVR